jgi:hypothetical protein
MLPPEGTLGFLDNGPRHGAIERNGVSIFRDGKWSAVKFDPTHWTEQETNSDG